MINYNNCTKCGKETAAGTILENIVCRTIWCKAYGSNKYISNKPGDIYACLLPSRRLKIDPYCRLQDGFDLRDAGKCVYKWGPTLNESGDRIPFEIIPIKIQQGDCSHAVRQHRSGGHQKSGGHV
jgi:hypothetical protein